MQLCPVGHTIPQPPQLRASTLVLISQPLATWPSQFAKPGLQVAIAHTPLTHAAVAFGKVQTMPQPPQLAEPVKMLVSQPSARVPLQLANPALHVPTHVRPPPLTVHTPLPLLNEQKSPAVFPAQAASDATVHTPFAHTPDAQCVPHVPQLFGSELVSAHCPLQSLVLVPPWHVHAPANAR